MFGLENLGMHYGSLLKTWANRSHVHASQTIWGDGLVEQSLTTAWYPCRWDDVSDDELVYLIPSLTARHDTPRDEGAISPAAFVEPALIARYDAFLRSLSASGIRRDDAIAIVLESGAVTSLVLDGALERRLSSGPLPTFTAAPIGPVTRDLLVFELSVLACLDQMHAAALCEVSKISHVRGAASPSPADALVSSIHARLNAAYFYPDYVCLHELLATGAWLGHLLSGRSALMPVFVAECLTESIATAGCRDADACRRVLTAHADLAIGSKRLLAMARRVRSSGTPIVVGSRRIPSPPALRPIVWNANLFQRFDRFLDDRYQTLGTSHAETH
jgi:hypothetical protein